MSLLADSQSSEEAVAEMRWQEWGRPPELENPAWWLETTVLEAGREELPVTFVAHDVANEVLERSVWPTTWTSGMTPVPG